jgi:hypothetical protein
MCIVHLAHLLLEVLLYTATFNEIQEQQFTSVLPLLSIIINPLCIKVQVTNNYSNPYLTAAPPTAHFNNPLFSITIQYCQPPYLIASTGEWWDDIQFWSTNYIFVDFSGAAGIKVTSLGLANRYVVLIDRLIANINSRDGRQQSTKLQPRTTSRKVQFINFDLGHPSCVCNIQVQCKEVKNSWYISQASSGHYFRP